MSSAPPPPGVVATATTGLPLAGVRVLDLTHLVAGPYCTLLLADGGAEVIKVEIPGRGELSRSEGPFLPGPNGTTTSAYFLRQNRNKKSLSLDLKSARGVELFKDLVARSSVVVENFRPSTMERLGIGYEVLREVNPALVLASISGFGQPSVLPSPYSDLPAMAVMIEAFSGLMDQAGEADRPPALLGFPVGDIFAGALAASGILMALRRAEATGVGEHVDVAMFDAAVSLNERALTHLSVTGEVLSRSNKMQMMIGPLDVYRTRDGFVTVAAAVQNTWAKFAGALDIPELRSDPRFAKGADRAQNREALKTLVERWTSERTTAEVIDTLRRAEVPAAPVRGIDDVFADEGVHAREMLVEVEHPIAGRVRLTGNPIKLGANPHSTSSAPPLLGEHTDAILADVLGVDAEEIAQLHACGVV